MSLQEKFTICHEKNVTSTSKLKEEFINNFKSSTVFSVIFEFSTVLLDQPGERQSSTISSSTAMVGVTLLSGKEKGSVATALIWPSGQR